MGRAFAWIVPCLLGLSATASAADPFQPTTAGTPGTGGVVPQLSGIGTGLPGSHAALRLEAAAPRTSATLVVGWSEWALPFHGGVLGPAPDVVVPGLPVDALGELTLPFGVADDAPAGLMLWTQVWIADAGAQGGLSSSNSLAFAVAAVPAPLYDAASALVVATPAGGPAEVAVGDFDEDGIPDLAVAIVQDDVVQVLKGVGDGTVSARPLSSVPAPSGLSMAAADVDADGHLDLVITVLHADRIDVWYGLGDGRFDDALELTTGHLPVDVVVADVDGEDALDLVTADALGSVSVLLGRGGRTFHPAVTHALGGSNASSVAVGDLDGDGRQDLAVDFYGDFGYVALLFGEGGAAFAEPVVLPVGPLPEDLVLADLDGDGALDLSIVSLAAAAVEVRPGRGDGTFGPAQAYALPPGTQPMRLLCADLDEDGALDLVASRYDGLSILRGTGNGVLLPEEAVAIPGNLRFGLAATDLDLDGRLDLVTTRLVADEVLVLLQATPREPLQ